MNEAKITVKDSSGNIREETLKVGDKVLLCSYTEMEDIDTDPDNDNACGVDREQEEYAGTWVTVINIRSTEPSWAEFDIKEDGDEYCWSSYCIRDIRSKVVKLNEFGDYW